MRLAGWVGSMLVAATWSACASRTVRDASDKPDSGGTDAATSAESGGTGGGLQGGDSVADAGTDGSGGTSSTSSAGNESGGGNGNANEGGVGNEGGAGNRAGSGNQGGAETTGATGGVMETAGRGGVGPVDECAAALDNCDVNATCTDTQTSFTCMCNPGYIGNGVTCTCRKPSLDNVLISPGFDQASQISSWTPSEGASWVAEDADECSDSGAIRVEVTASFDFGHFSQCLRATPGTTYFFGYKYKQDADTRLVCNVWTFTSVDCSGSVVDLLVSQGAQISAPIDWTASTPDSMTASGGIRSIEVNCQTDFGVGYFDQIYLNPAGAGF